jgi:hypothetical protein
MPAIAPSRELLQFCFHVTNALRCAVFTVILLHKCDIYASEFRKLARRLLKPKVKVGLDFAGPPSFGRSIVAICISDLTRRLAG